MRKSQRTKNKKLVVLDHHICPILSTKALKEHVFSEVDSEQRLFKYFHPSIEVPVLIDYISDSDTWAHVYLLKEIGLIFTPRSLEF